MEDSISIHVEGVSKRFKATRALSDVALRFEAAGLHGIIGPEGAGKTTLLRIILGLLLPDRGQVDFMQGPRAVPFDQIRAELAYMPQQQSLYPDLSISEHLDFFRALYGIRADTYLKKRQELLHITRLGEFVDRPAAKLSGGMYKKLGLMCALLRSPRVILLDEPTNGVDPISRREFWELLYRLADQGILILVTTAYMDEAERCGIVHLLEDGKIVDEGEPRALLERERARSFDELFLNRAGRSESEPEPLP